jgi:serine phosphatase RsbU (regulator of sigma subunit)
MARRANRPVNSKPPAHEGGLEEQLASAQAESSAATALLRLASGLSEMRGLEDTIRRAMEACRDMFEADRVYLVSRKDVGAGLEVVGSLGFGDEPPLHFEGAVRASGLGLLADALERQQVVVVPDASTTTLLDAHIAESHDLGAFLGIPLLRGEAPLGGVGLEFVSPREFGFKEERMAQGAARLLGMALLNARRFTMLSRIRAFGLRISSWQRLGRLLEEIGAATRELVDAEHAEVVLVNGPEEEDEQLPWARLAQREVVELEREGKKGSVGSIATGLLAADGSILGALMVSLASRSRLGPLRTEAMRVAAAQAGIAIENSQRFERQRAMAKTLQRALVTRDVPVIEGYELAWIYETSEADADVGGDFYDVFELQDSVALVVGDISGKGLEAAAQTAMAKYMLRAFALRNHRPDSVLYHLNNALFGRIGTERFATAFYGLLDPKGHTLELALGGHPPPFVFRMATLRAEPVTAAGHLLGAFEDQAYTTEKTVLGPGDSLVVFTDGLIEARREDELFGSARVAASIERHGPQATAKELAQGIYRDAQSFGRVTDDTVVLTLKRVGEVQA